MGKIVKFCNSCNESFAEKFEFCPNCGKKMQAFEMNPIKKEEKTAEKPKPVIFEHDESPVVAEPETETFSTEQESYTESEEILELDSVDEAPNSIEVAPATFIPSKSADLEAEDEITSEKTEPEIFVPEKTEPNEAEAEYYSPYTPESDFQEVKSVPYAARDDDDFHVHFVKEKNSKQRNLLFLAAMFFMVSLSFGVVIQSIFAYDLNIGQIDEDLVALVPIIDETPMNLEEEIEQKKDKEGGGGGGGGREEDTPTSKGRLAPQTRQPILITPTKTIPIRDNPELKSPQAFTEGDEKPYKQTDERYGDPTSKYSNLSDGLGSGGGQGSGRGTGQGSGEGTGRGSGKGSGSGGGLGTGNGDGTGEGSGNASNPPPRTEPKTTGISRKAEFLSKPSPRYTEEARKNNYTGTITLRVTFLPNGRVGNVAPVNRLPYGLTEEAIAAARRIQFKPAMRNGQPIGETRRVQYTFTIY